VKANLQHLDRQIRLDVRKTYKLMRGEGDRTRQNTRELLIYVMAYGKGRKMDGWC